MSTFKSRAEQEESDISPEVKVIEALVLCVIIIVSVVGNTSLWVVVLRSRALRSITSMFILGLSAADLLVAVVNMPLTVYTIFVGYWTFSDSACVVIGFINMFTLVLSVMSLCNISINRFFMVCRPSKFKDVYTTRNAVLMILATVICSILLSSPPLFGWSEYVYTSTHSFCFADWVNYRSYAYFMIVCCFGIPFSVMTVCNIFIIRFVRESSRRVISTYRTTLSLSIVNSDDNQEINKSGNTGDQKDTVVNKTDNNNTHNSSPAIKDDLETMQMESQSENKVINSVNDKINAIENDQTSSSLNVDAVSISSSNESSSGFLKSGERRGLKRNKLFSGGNSHREQLKKILNTERKIVPKQSIVKRNSFHLQCDQQPSDIREDPVSNDSITETSISAAQTVAATPDKVATPDQSAEPAEKPVMRQNTTNLRRREEIRLAVSLIIVVVLFVICWLPYCISMLISIHYRGEVPKQFHMFTLLIGYANSGCNPIVYGVMNQRFKVGFKRLFCFWKPHRMSLSSNS